jgi:hypothetical protein
MVGATERLTCHEQTLGLGLSVALSVKGEVEWETGLEAATFTLEGLSG